MSNDIKSRLDDLYNFKEQDIMESLNKLNDDAPKRDIDDFYDQERCDEFNR